MNFKTVIKECGHLDPIVNACYVLVNGHEDNINEQLGKVNLSKLVYFLQLPNTDKETILKAYYLIFKHSWEQHYQRIIILNDTVVIDECLAHDFVKKDIINFVQTKNPDLFWLGCIIKQIKGMFNSCFQLEKKYGLFAGIYSQRIIVVLMYYLKHTYFKLGLEDLVNQVISSYTYCMPLVYDQIDPNTEFGKDKLGDNLVQHAYSGLINYLLEFKGFTDPVYFKKAYRENYLFFKLKLLCKTH